MRRTFVLAALLCPLSACTHHFFRVEGAIASDGGHLGAWRSIPQGCSRDPIDGPATPANVTFLWDDTTARDRFRQTHYPHLPNSPGRLELWQTSSGIAGKLETQKPVTLTTLDRKVCSKLQLESSEGKPVLQGGRPTLQGSASLDCRIGDSHLTADLHFSGCEF